MEHSFAVEPASRATTFLRNPSLWLNEKKLGQGFWTFFAVAFFFDFGFAVYFFLFNLYLLDLHFNERAMGLIGGAFTLGSVVGTLPAGVLARRLGLRPMLLICFVAAPVMGILRTTTTAQPAQIALAFGAGLAMCLWGVCFLPAIAQLTTPDNRASAFGLIYSVSIGTSALGGLLCGYLPGWLHTAGFAFEPAEIKRFILLTACALAALGLIPLFRLRLPSFTDSVANSDPDSVPSVTLTPKTRWILPPFLYRFLPAMALWTAVLVSFTPFANVYLTRDLHIPLAQIGLIFSAAQLIQFAVGLLTPFLFRSLGLINGIVATQVATAVAVGCLAGTHHRGLAVVLYLTFSATQWMSSPGLYNLLMSSVPERDRSSASALTMFTNALLQSVATPAAGILFVRFGYPRVLVGIALLALASAALFRFLMPSATDQAA